MRNISGHLAFGLIAALALLISGCSSSAGINHSEAIAAQLAKNTALKRGWSELPVPIYISNSVPEKFRPAIIEAMDMWNTEAGIAVFEYAGEAPNDTQARDELNGVYWDENPSPNGYFGETRTSIVNDNVIVESDMMFFDDPDGFDVLTCDNGEEVCKSNVLKKDLTTTALHELGHVLGFVHTDGATDIMNPNFYRGDVHHAFDNVLIAELQDIYEPIMLADAR